MLVYFWPTVYNVGPKVSQCWANVSCLLGCPLWMTLAWSHFPHWAIVLTLRSITVMFGTISGYWKHAILRCYMKTSWALRSKKLKKSCNKLQRKGIHMSIYIYPIRFSAFTLPTFHFQLPTSPFRLFTSDFILPASDFPLPTSHFPLPTSHFWFPTSDFSLPTSYFRLATSYFLLPTSYFPFHTYLL